MFLRIHVLRSAFAIVFFSAAVAASASRSDDSSHGERLGQNIEKFGRRLDVAQLFGQPAADPDEESPPARSRDASAATVRIDRLESQLRSLTGLVERLQYDIRRLEDQLRRAQQDAGPQRGAAAPPPADQPAVGAAPGAGGLRRGDAFDPNRDPNAVGTPRPLGSTAPSGPLAGATPGPYMRPTAPNGAGSGAPPAPASSDLRSPGAPLDLTHGRLSEPAPSIGGQPAAPAPAAAGPIAAPSAAPTAPQTPKDEFDVAVSHLRQGEYEAAEKGFSAFLAKNSKSRFAPQATFDLGESFFLRARYREAAEKYLEISTKYATSSQAPEAMLRLGQSLHALGAKEQACASFNEIAVKYPGAAARIKEAAQRESKKVQC